jgi:hypothetical protein
MSATLAQVLITLATVKTPLPAGIQAGSLSVVVTDSAGAAQPAVAIPAPGPYSLTTSLPISSDGVTVAASVQATALDSTGAPIGAPGPVIPLTLTEPSFDAPGSTATMTLTPAAAAANPAVAAAVRKA